MISVIMSIYKETNEELCQAINSILNQTYKDFEFIIIIDDPEPQKIEFIKTFDDNRIKLIINECNIGLVASLNKGIKAARGAYIARMDADDISEPNRLEIQMAFLEKKGYDLCGTYIQTFYKGEKQAIIDGPSNPDNVEFILKNHNCVSHPTWLGKKEVFEKNNGYRDVFACEDYDFLIRACKNGFLLSNVPIVLLNYRLSENSISRKNPGKQEIIAEYLGKNFKKNKITDLKQINEYLNSDKFYKKIKKYDRCNLLKIKKSRSVSKKLPKYYWYTFLLCCNCGYTLKILKNKIMYRYILMKEKIKLRDFIN